MKISFLIKICVFLIVFKILVLLFDKVKKMLDRKNKMFKFQFKLIIQLNELLQVPLGILW